jgi:hypothetical protein
MNKSTSQGQIHHSLRPLLLLATYVSAGRIARELWWKNQMFPSVGITPPWLSMLLYHLGFEQQAC